MLRQKTQRRLSRALFLTGCVLPTLAIGAWAAARFHPAYQETLLGAVGRAAGVSLDFDRLSTPKPGEYEIQGLRVIDPTSGIEIARCNFLRLNRHRGVIRFAADRVVITSPKGGPATPRPLDHGAWAVEGRIGSLALLNAEGAELCRWTRMHCTTSEFAAFPRLPDQDDYRPIAAAWTESEEPAEAMSCLVYEDDQQRQRVSFETGSIPLPCQLLAASPLPGPITRSTTFLGAIEASLEEDAARGEAKGKLRFEPFASLSASWSTAEVELIEARWTGRRIDTVHARVDARSGLLSRNLVYGMYTMLGCQPRQALVDLWESSPDEEPVPYGRLACEVRLDPQGLVLFGRCGEQDGVRRSGAIAHAVLAQGEEPLLIEPRERPQAISRIVRAFWPDDEPELPASAEAQEVASRLPLPAKPQPR